MSHQRLTLTMPPTMTTPAKPPEVPERSRGFRPMSRRRARIAAGAALAAVGVGGNVLVYSSLGDTQEVLQVTSDIRPGELLTAADMRVVAVDLDPTVPVLPASQLAAVVNQYARVYIASGTLLVDTFVQPRPLVSDGHDVVAVEIRATRVPAGLRERSLVMLVIPAAGSVAGEGVSTALVQGRVVSRGELGAESSGSGAAIVTLSVEVPIADAAVVAAADDVRVALLDPGVDEAIEADR